VRYGRGSPAHKSAIRQRTKQRIENWVFRMENLNPCSSLTSIQVIGELSWEKRKKEIRNLKNLKHHRMKLKSKRKTPSGMMVLPKAVN
jgi:hypothetical protein